MFFVLITVLFLENDVFGQSSLNDLVYGKPKTPVSKPAKKTEFRAEPKKPAKKQQTPVTEKKPTATVPKVLPAKKSQPQRKLVNVTFVGNEPLMEVWLNEKKIGLTNEKFQLVQKIYSGTHRLMAKNKREVTFSAAMITISPEQNIFKIYNDAPPRTEAKALPKETPKPEKSPLEMAIVVSAKVKSILETYQDPATTDSVTTEDWQFVFEAAQYGQLQGYTAVQIEAYRWFASGQIELSKKDYTNALTAFNKSQEFMPNSALPFFGLGNTYLANQQLQDALKLYQKAIRNDRKLSMAYKKLGDTQRLLSKDKEAIAAYKSAIQLGYKTPETRYWLATLMLENKQIEAGLKELEEVVKEMPRPEVYISIGKGYEKLKRDVSAIEAYLKAIEVDPNSSVAYYKLANVYHDQREYTKAKEAYEKSIAMDPTGKVVNITDAQKKLREVSAKIGSR